MHFVLLRESKPYLFFCMSNLFNLILHLDFMELSDTYSSSNFSFLNRNVYNSKQVSVYLCAS